MKLNLGCGYDIKEGYLNVDFRDIPGVTKADLSKLPWPFNDGAVEEILMLDFLEHFPYRKTIPILQECWRILKPDGNLVIQVPDLTHCARAASFEAPFLCNKCGWEFPIVDYRADFFICEKCRQPWVVCAEAAIHRLYGGQDYDGNWHHTAFTMLQLDRLLQSNGFDNITELEAEHQYINWNFKIQCKKSSDPWSEE